MTAFVVKSLLIATLVITVVFTVERHRSQLCPSPRFAQIGNTNSGRTIIVFDTCLGDAYATDVYGLPEPGIQPQKDVEI